MSAIPSGTLDKFTTFGDLLRYLRRRAGLTQMELSIAVNYSDAQISRLEQNLRLPDVSTIEARFVSALGLEDEPKAVARLLELAATIRREDAPGPGLCPYKGLDCYEEVDAELFAGRETLTGKLTQRVLGLCPGSPGSGRFLAIVGASGSGKSSLARAGLASALRWDRTSAGWPIRILTPSAHPLESLAASLTRDGGSVAATASLMDDLAREPRSLGLFSRQVLKLSAASHLVVVVDQFEELFTLCRAEDERSSFIDNLLSAASEPDGRVVVVITLRADFYAHCAAYPALREAIAGQQEYIGAMDAEELRRAVEEPARRGRWDLEPGLVELLLRDVGQEPGALPLLSHALWETWQRRRGRTLTLGGYTASGGVAGAIAETAESVFADRLTAEQRTIARRIFLRLTELGDENAGGATRRCASFDELILRPDEAVATQAVLQALADARLITIGEDSAEVAHEALIREWPTLRGWLAENREGLRLHRNLAEATLGWLKAGREPDLLYRGVRLAQAREWTATHDGDLNLQEREFLAASMAFSEREAAAREEQRERELAAARKLADVERQRAAEQACYAAQLRRRAVILAGAFVVAVLMALVAVFFGSQARQAAAAAQEERRIGFSRELAAEAIGNLDADPELSLLLATQAVSVTYTQDRTATAEAEDALRRGLLASRVELTLSPSGSRGRAWAVAFSPDGSRLGVASDDGSARIWATGAGGHELLVLPTNATRGHQGIAFSPALPGSTGGMRVLTAGEMGKARVWDAETGAALLTLTGHTNWVTAVAFSPDGRRLATASEDRTARIWDAETGQSLLVLTGHTARVFDVAFSPVSPGGAPGEARVATGSADGTAIVWNAETGERLFTLSGHTGGVIAVAFSPAPPSGGAYLATAGADGTTRLWDAAGRLLLTLRGHTDAIAKVREIAPGGNDTQIARARFTLAGHSGAVNGILFSPDGLRLATAGQDGTAKLWDVGTGREVLSLAGQTDAVAAVSFVSGCGETGCRPQLLTTSVNGMVRAYLLRIEDLMDLAAARLTRSMTPAECRQYLHTAPEQCGQDAPATAPLTASATAESVDALLAPARSARDGSGSKVCEVTDSGGVNDGFYNQGAFQGMQKAAARLGLAYAVFESQQPADYETNVAKAVESGCHLIVAPIGSNFGEIIKAAAAHPDLKFLTVEWAETEPQDNVWAQTYAVDQGGFLAGYLAAAVTKTGKVGTFGGDDFPLVTGFMDGFSLGVAYYNEQHGARVQVLGWDAQKRDGLFTGSFTDMGLGRRVGTRLLEEGADVLLPVAGAVGMGTAAAIKERGNAYLIGVDTDWALTAPEYADIVLTSIEKRVDVSVASAIEELVDGSFTGGTHLGTLENGGVSIAPFHDLDGVVTPEIKAELAQIKAGIIAGRIRTKP